MPPYTTRSSGRSATSGSRLFISMRSGASVSQLFALSCVPRAARTTRAFIAESPKSGTDHVYFSATRGEKRGLSLILHLASSLPHLPGDVHHDLQLAPLLVLGEQISGDP